MSSKPKTRRPRWTTRLRKFGDWVCEKVSMAFVGMIKWGLGSYVVITVLNNMAYTPNRPDWVENGTAAIVGVLKGWF